MDPTINLPQGAPDEGGSAISTMGIPIAIAKHARTATCAINVRDHIPDVCALLLDQPGQVEVKNKIKNERADTPDNPLPTSVSVENLEAALSSHPNQNFVLELCNIFKYGAHIGFHGKRSARFSKNFTNWTCTKKEFGKISHNFSFVIPKICVKQHKLSHF